MFKFFHYTLTRTNTFILYRAVLLSHGHPLLYSAHYSQACLLLDYFAYGNGRERDFLLCPVSTTHKCDIPFIDHGLRYAVYIFKDSTVSGVYITMFIK